MRILCCCNNPAEFVPTRKYFENLGYTFDIIHNSFHLQGIKPGDYDIVFANKFFAGGSLLELKEMGFNCVDLESCGSIRKVVNEYINKNSETEPVQEPSIRESIFIDTNPTQDRKFWIGKSEPYQNLYSRISKFAPIVNQILLFGKTGTGKEHIALEIHKASKVKGKFVSVDCGAITDELINSELFGHIKGAFTGAVKDKIGYFEEANGGTIFFDEIENLSYKGQISLLRVLQERTFKRVGSTKEQRWDAKVVCATNVDLRKEVEQGRFRSDLYYRISQITLTIPSLEDILEEVPDLIDFLVKEISEEFKINFIASEDFKLKTIENLIPFSGNIRELKSYLVDTILNGDIVNSNLSGIELMQSMR